MNQFYRLQPILTDADIAELAIVANEIWHEYFPSILSAEQIDYMVQKFQSYEALCKAVHGDYNYTAVKDGKDIIGYIGIKEEAERLFLSKLYLKKDARGKGLGREMLETVIEYAKDLGKKSVYLTVNRLNDTAIRLYTKMGFLVQREESFDIGNGFKMDDYIMELKF